MDRMLHAKETMDLQRRTLKVTDFDNWEKGDCDSNIKCKSLIFSEIFIRTNKTFVSDYKKSFCTIWLFNLSVSDRDWHYNPNQMLTASTKVLFYKQWRLLKIDKLSDTLDPLPTNTDRKSVIIHQTDNHVPSFSPTLLASLSKWGEPFKMQPFWTPLWVISMQRVTFCPS